MEIPDNVRPYVDALVKHHFWLLAVLVPCLVLPTVLMATGDLNRKIVASQGEIDGKLGSVQQVMRNAEHPNEKWSETLRADTKKIKRETLREWERFWEAQAGLRVWPDALGRDFVEKASQLQPGGKLPQKLLERYNNDIRSIVRTIPKRMGADEAMREASADEAGPRTARQPAATKPGSGTNAATIIRWNASDQKRLYDSFDWRKPPTTAQVQLAQEELWLYGMLCDVIASMNARSTGAFDSVVPYVEELAVGYPAAEDKPGGAGEGRVMRVAKAAEAAAGVGGDPGGDAAGSQPLVRPAHPRFQGGATVDTPRSGSPEPDAIDAGGGAGQAASADDRFRNWIYVDFDGKPLMASEITASLTYRMIHLVPFRLRAVMDQRRLDDLLMKLAGSTIPVDVRQVRVNPGGARSMPSDTGGRGSTGADGGVAAGRRPFDVTVELRGSIALAAQPDRKAVLGDAAGEEPAAEEPQEEERDDNARSEPAKPAEAAPPAEGTPQ